MSCVNCLAASLQNAAGSSPWIDSVVIKFLTLSKGSQSSSAEPRRECQVELLPLLYHIFSVGLDKLGKLLRYL